MNMVIEEIKGNQKTPGNKWQWKIWTEPMGSSKSDCKKEINSEKIPPENKKILDRWSNLHIK